MLQWSGIRILRLLLYGFEIAVAKGDVLLSMRTFPFFCGFG